MDGAAGLLNWLGSIYELQRWLYGGVREMLVAPSGTGWDGLAGLAGAAFGFGLLHALLPGHGKTVLASHFAGSGRALAAVGASAIVVVTHVGLAVAFVIAGFAVVERTVAAAGRAPALEQASHVLIVLVGLWLLWRSQRRAGHGQDQSGPLLGLVAGLVPCPLTTFVMIYCLANDIVLTGLLLSAAFAAGMVATVAAFPLLAVLFRQRLMGALSRSEQWRRRVGKGLETLAALAVVTLGLWPLVARFPA